ncbi:rod-determining factor RdfA [Halegenticoccus tardaugens]|uniref:rod-determining factor RdfA n=1 Tax=Halegenticoccus tardaugens TaxID=2071624 RepID=UPI00100B57C4|nr:rod-determining factor RdfA [Halegenticoccus tardaugens]
MSDSRDGATSENVPDQTNSKVGRLIERYGLNGMGDRIERLWTGDGVEDRSLRDLADYFNQRILEAEMDEHGMETLDGEVKNMYRLLTEDDISGGIRTEAENTLKRNGIDVDQVMRNFVSHQAVYTYLTKYRGAKKTKDDPGPDARLEKSRETIRRLRSRLVAVAESTLKQLRNSRDIVLGEFSVFVDIRVLCEDCGSQYPVSELLENGGCDCQPDE